MVVFKEWGGGVKERGFKGGARVPFDIYVMCHN